MEKIILIKKVWSFVDGSESHAQTHVREKNLGALWKNLSSTYLNKWNFYLQFNNILEIYVI